MSSCLHLRRLGAIALAVLSAAWGSAAHALTSSHSYTLSFTNQRKIVRASTGTLAMLYQKGSGSTTGGIRLAISRDDGVTWTDVLQARAQSSVYPDALIEPSNDIVFVWSTNNNSAGSANDVGFVRLLYQPLTDDWVKGSEVLVHNSDSTMGAFNAVTAYDGTHHWAAYRFVTGGLHRIRVEHSADGGATWEDNIETDTPGLNADETAAFAVFGSKLALVDYHQDRQFKWRWRNNADPPLVWSAPELIHDLVSGGLTSKSSWSLLADDGGKLHLLFGFKGVKAFHYDGVAWTNEVVHPGAGAYTALSTNGTDLWAVWRETVGSSQFHILKKRFDAALGTWDALPTKLNPVGEDVPGHFSCFSQLAGTSVDLTAKAASSSSKDVKHPTTLALLRDVGDSITFGLAVPYDYLRIQLSTSGAGGAVVWEYWNGAAWTAFAPSGGSYQFLKSNSVQLWPNLASAPADWTPALVGGPLLYLVQARVTTAYTTAPVGTQVTSVKQNLYPTSIARDPATIISAYAVGLSGPFPIIIHRLTP